MSKCAKGRIYKTIDSETGDYIEIYCRSTRHHKCYSEVWVRSARTGMFMFRARYLALKETLTLYYEGSRDNNIYIDANAEADVNTVVFNDICHRSGDLRRETENMIGYMADRITDLILGQVDVFFGYVIPIDEAEIGHELHAKHELSNVCGEFPSASFHLVWRHHKGGTSHERSGCGVV